MPTPGRRTLTVFVVLYITFIGGTDFARTGPIPDSVHLIIIAGPIVLWLGRLIRTGRAFPRTALDTPLLVFVAWLMFTALVAQDRRLSLEAIWPVLLAVLGFYYVVDLIRRGWERHLWAALGLAAVIVAGLCMLKLATWYVGGLGMPGWFPIGGLDDPVPVSMIRLDLAPAMTPNTLGNFLAMLIPLTGVYFLTSRRRVTRGIWGVVGAALIIAGAFTLSRGALLGLCAGIGTLIALRLWQVVQSAEQRTIIHYVIVTGIALAGGIGLFVFMYSYRFNALAVGSIRQDTWRSALDMAHDHPVVGVGPGQFGYQLWTYRDPQTVSWNQVATAHNLPLQVLSETGLPGLLIVVWLGGAFLWMWYKNWCTAPSAASAEQRLRLSGTLAVLAAYVAHGQFGVFMLPVTLLPLVILGAYTAAYPAPSPAAAYTHRHNRIAWGALLITGVFSVWILVMDVAQARMMVSLFELPDGDLPYALELAESARTWDPDLSLYALHEAYVLGLLADDDPETYLDRAIEAHESALAQVPTYDVGWVNLSALYAQRGDTDAAHDAIQRAVAISPFNGLYWFLLGDYQRALEKQVSLAEYVAEADPASLTTFLNDETIDPDQRLLAAVLASSSGAMTIEDNDFAGLVRLVEDHLQRSPKKYPSRYALGRYAFEILGDDEQALAWFSLAIDGFPTADAALIERAKVYLAQGDLNAAEHDAKTALFINSESDTNKTVLQQIDQQRHGSNEQPDDIANTEDTTETGKSGDQSPWSAGQDFPVIVYARPSQFDFLPQLDLPD
ncbi:MAG: O-antigen ligase family protein [Anaerolineae bacterium]|nr:O-antigen ligase family protein [Anaerolineae bacterium]